MFTAKHSNRIKIILSIVCIMFLFLYKVSFGETDYYKPITSIDLGIKKLELNIGETYTFKLSYEPADTPSIFISWLTDKSILQIDEENYSVKAITPGTARLLVESNAGFTWDYCDITVNGAAGKDANAKKAGTEIISLAANDREKIKAQTVQNYISFLENSSFTEEQYTEVSKRSFNITAIVIPEMIEYESNFAVLVGMEKVLPLPDLNAVSLRGTIAQILEFTAANPELLEIIEFAPMDIIEPIDDASTEEKIEKSLTLGTHVETLTSVSIAHSRGYTGAGTAVAIIDTGINKNHEQFQGRVIAEACYGLTGNGNYYPVCTAGSSEPSLSNSIGLHNHGSHVTGIAAGRNGIAPDAKIVSINISVEDCSGSKCVQTLYWNPYEVAQYLKNLQDQYKANNSPLISAVNLSLGSGSYSSVCDASNSTYKNAFDLLVENDMIPVAASGNDGYTYLINCPACLSNAFSVGALSKSLSPTVADFSNHNSMVDILAPGEEIWSALYNYREDGDTCIDGIYGEMNCYGYMDGTSMATPMVTGAFAILRQANPSLSVAELEEKLISMSVNTVNHKVNGTEFDFSKPTLDFTNFITRPMANEVKIQNSDGINITGQTITVNSRHYQLNGVASPSGALQKFDWSSNANAIAQVDGTGMVIFQSAGSATITASAKDGSMKSASVKLILPQQVANQVCGTNVYYSIDGNTINFSKINPNTNAVWASDCGDVYKNDPNITILNISDEISLQNYANFSGSTYIQEMYLSKLDVSQMTWLSGMFENCTALNTLDVSSWNTTSAKYMSSMFKGCTSLTYLDLNNWNTSNATSMYSMFDSCSSLTGLNISNWNTVNVDNMEWMFRNCSSLASLDISSWNTSNVKQFDYMFENCISLSSLDLNNWNTSNATSMRSMFSECSSLKSLGLGLWNTSNLKYMSYMFEECSSLISLDLSGWNTSLVSSSYSVFRGCTSLNSIKLGTGTLNTNIFETLPNYNSIWYYVGQGISASNPLSLGTAMANSSLFTSYNYSKMAGIWSTDMNYPLSVNRLILPSGLKEIGDNSFAGSSSIEEVVIPNGLTKIGTKAFAGSSIRKINIPNSVTNISDDAFRSTANLIFICQSNNTGAAYARQHDIPYRIGN